jgi:A/G-specific adenine glycosylase
LPVPEDCFVNIKSVSAEKKHILSHQVIFARLIHLEIGKTEGLSSSLVQVNQKDISKFAVPKLLEGFIDELKT